MPKKLNRFQRAAFAVYAEGEFSDYTRGDFDRLDQNHGDTLAVFILRELEGVTAKAEAIIRMAAAAADLEIVADAIRDAIAVDVDPATLHPLTTDRPNADVLIAVTNGVAEAVIVPSGVTVHIRDYDVEGTDDDQRQTDAHGDYMADTQPGPWHAHGYTIEEN